MVLSRHGTGMCMMMDFMLMYFLPTAILCGGTGDGIGALPDQDIVLAGDGLLHGIIAAGILHIGMAVTGVATGPVTGARDGIIIIRTIRRMDGEEDGMVILIPTITAVQRMWYGEVL